MSDPRDAAAFLEVCRRSGDDALTRLAALADERRSLFQFRHEPLAKGLTCTNVIAHAPDAKLAEYGRSHALSRGLPVVWSRGRGAIVANGGFHVKFNNDVPADHEALAAGAWVSSLFVARKWSGYLTGLVLYPVLGADGREATHAVVVSKHSASPDSEFVRRAAALWHARVSEQDRERLRLAGVCCVWCECLSRSDQQHGAAVREDHLHPIAVRMTDDSVGTRMARAEEMVSLLAAVPGLPTDPVVRLEGTDRTSAFVHALVKKRDRLSESRFVDLLGSFLLPEESQHSRILGDTLEGLVLSYEDGAGAERVIKFKFPNYGVRTFFLRTLTNKGAACGEIDARGAWRIRPEAVAVLESFLGRWVGEENRDWWRGRAVEMAKRLGALWRAEKHDAPAALADQQAGSWIRAADVVEEAIANGTAAPLPLSAVALTAQAWRAPYTALVLLVLGPIGWGKTRAADALARRLGCAHVDGDRLLGCDDARCLGAERNVATFSAIALALAERGRVVVSCGGGALGSGSRAGWTFVLPSKLRAALPNAHVQIAVATPSEASPGEGSTEWRVLRGAPDEGSVRELYESDATRAEVEQIVHERIARREWQDEGKGMAKQVAQQSKINFRFYGAISQVGSLHLTYPRATRTGEQSPPPAALVHEFLARLDVSPSSSLVLMANQLRMAYAIPATTTSKPPPRSADADRDGRIVVKHETIRFDAESFPVDPEALVPSTTPVDARFVRVDGKTGCALYVLPTRVYAGKELADQHVTVNPGHTPKGLPRRPATMRAVARALIRGESAVAIDEGDHLALSPEAIAIDRVETIPPVGWIVDAFAK